MLKKIILAVLALSILSLVISLFARYKKDTELLAIETQKTSRIDFIEDKSPSLIAFDTEKRMWVYGSDEILNKNGSLVVYENEREVARYDRQDSPVLTWLPSLTSHIAFHKDGTVWVGTGGQDGGLAMFDGDTWTTFDLTSDLPTNWITALKLDDRGRAWVGFYEHGLGIYDTGSWLYLTSENSGLSVNTIRDIAIDEQGRAWITTDRGGVNIFDATDWDILNTSNSNLAHDSVGTLLFDDQGRLWIDAWVGINVYDSVNNSWVHYPLTEAPFESMFFDSSGRFWAESQKGVVLVFDGENWEKYVDTESSIHLILPDPKGDILMSGENEIRSVAAQDVEYNLQIADLTSTRRETKRFVESGGLFVLSIILVLFWCAGLFNSWWTMLVTALVGVPVYLIWNLSFGGSAPAEAPFFSGPYVWNPGVLLCLTILTGGMLGRRVKRPNDKSAEWPGILLGIVVGLTLNCAFLLLAFLLMAR